MSARVPPVGGKYAEVLIDGLALADPRPYTYVVPESWLGRLRPGQPVLVPFGPKRGVGGYVVALTDEPPDDHALKEIEDVVAGDVVPPSLQALLAWIAEVWLASMQEVVTTAMPRGTLTRVKRTVHLAVSPETFRSLARGWTGAPAVLAAILLDHGGECPLTVLQTGAKRSSAVLADWRRRDLVRYQTRFEPPQRAEKRQLHAVATEGAYDRLTARQAEVLAALHEAGGVLPVAELTRRTGATPEVVKRLAKAGALVVESRAVRRTTAAGPAAAGVHALTPHQAEVVDAIVAKLGEAASFLLHGVTGSGKTEVYMQVLERVLDAGRGAIVLVPEIALTPQTVRRFQSRFGDTVAVLHSHLGEGERYDEWQRIRSGEARVVIGARSAVFAPVDDLGCIIIDEEHETSYKQDKAPRYHARAVAAERARLEGALLVLGSATPSIESYAATKDGTLTLLEMPERVESRPLPPVKVVDMRAELKAGNRGLFSRALGAALGGALARGEQTILLLNRRGYSSFVFCRECGYACKCGRCSVAMTYHAEPPILRCHYCDARERVPEVCPQCHGPYIRHFGAGTQQIEEACRKLFPDARILRVDRDTTSRKGSHERLLDAFGDGEYDVLVGTQMVAKGLDFPRVTLVGVMAADSAINLPDFRAGERTFQLLSQVAGRAGRHELPGEVVIQTYNPEHPAIVAASHHDYRAFYDAELPDRQEVGWPPYRALANAVIAGPDVRLARDAAARFADALEGVPGVEVFGPHDAPLSQLRGLRRYQVLLKVADPVAARPALRRAIAVAQEPGVRVTLDVDPYNLM
jgi:primosomal protein N' (replication factor Y)